MKNNNCYSVEEGSSGVLYLTDDFGNIEKFHPNCCLNKTREYLYEYYDLETSTNNKIKDSFVVGELDWFPSTVSPTYWQFFYQYVKYESLIERWQSGDISFKHIGPGRFRDLLHSLSCERRRLREFIINFTRLSIIKLINIRNKLLISGGKDKILFLRQSNDDFRTNEILENLRKNFSVVQLLPLSALKFKNIFFDATICILPVSHNNTKLDYFSNVRLDNGHLPMFHCALENAKKIISRHVATYDVFDRYLSSTHFSAFVGLDDCNYPYPYIYSAQNNGIKTIGIQHGAYTRLHEAYVMNNLDNHLWYDNLLVWGLFWKEEFLKNNKIFNPNNVFLSENKHKYQYKILPNSGSTKSILIPYEFLADTILIGKFIQLFYQKGFIVYFKPRKDEEISEQIRAYELGPTAHKLEVVHEITPELMSNIDIVVGTMTTLLYDLLPYNKPVWILETPFKLQYDMVENGLARFISWSDMNDIDKIYDYDLAKNININERRFSYGRPASDVIFNILSN